ncbi:MAG: Protease HtpX [Chlamydiae bacterium]|nr:Protease HtpX [Chlamydiota bacterium]
MYGQIFSLIILMLVINFSFEMTEGFWDLSSLDILVASIGGYLLCLGIIALQSRIFRPRGYAQIERMSLVTNLELLTYFFFTFLMVGVQIEFPWMRWSLTLLSAGSIILYLFGMALFRYTAGPNPELRLRKAAGHVRFLIPFLIPYFTLTLILDLDYWVFGVQDDLIFTIVALSLLILSLLFLPFFLQKFWQCTPLPDDEFHEKLKQICQKAHFKHGGMKVWTIMGNTMTAAIVGLIPRFRYVMFTPKLLTMLAPEHIEAILAHEIGHSKNYHLILYPFIILGMMVSVGLFFDVFGASMDYHPVLVFIPYVLIMWLYFRFVFGYFSRLFERQADLYGFQLGIPLHSMIGALDHIAIAAGNIHHHPSWHHFGIQQRIDYLRQVTESPQLIPRHNKKVKLSLVVYFIILSLGILKLFW